MDIFDKIIAGEIPSNKVYEDDYCIVILDIAPIRKGHCLVISKESVDTISKLTEKTYLNICNVVRRLSQVMREQLPCDAVNVFINDGRDAGQEVPHVHIHVVPRKAGDERLNIGAEKKKYSQGEAAVYAEKLRFN